MVGHQAKGVHPEPKSLVRYLEDRLLPEGRKS
jgi:hypothetical protein